MDKRIIEETPSTEVLNDDWLIKDSPTGGTSKILGSKLKEIISGDVEDSIDKILDSIAPEWSPTFTYGFDSYVIYEGELWRCFKDTGSTVGEFKTSEWIKAVTSGYITHVVNKIADRFAASNPPYMTRSYSVGDMVFYSEPYHDEQLYVCNTDLPQGESTFNPEHWDVVYTVAGLSKYLMDKIEEAGQIDDVQVKTTGDYESVVDENKVAKIDLSNVLIEKSVPNLPQSIATFKDGSDLPLKSLTASIVPVQAGSGDPSPTNVRPISGWTEEVITRTGKNLFDKTTISENKIINNNTGEETSSYGSNGRFSSDYIKVNPSTVYYASNVIKSAQWYCSFYYDKNKNYLSCGELPSSGDTASGVLTTPSNCNYVRLVGITTYKDDVSFVVGNQAPTTYEPYAGTTYTIPFTDGQGQSVEVFGGTLDVTSGVLTVDRMEFIYDGSSDENWAKVGSTSASAFAMCIDSPFVYMITDVNQVKCNFLKTILSNATWGNEDNWVSYTVVGGIAKLCTGIQSITEVEDWKTYLSSNNLQVCYELATPLTIQLTPTAVKSLDGENNVSASTGQITKLDYIANATDVIANLEARVTALENQ